MEFTEAILQEIAATYDPALSEAPLVIGHPKLNAPAYGWAKGLEVREGMLYAEPHQVVPEFAEAANRKMYKKRSASVYLPDSPGNPVPGKHYLRHIGFLGAVPPAIKGIPDAPFNFAEDDGALAIEFAEAPYAVTGLTDILRRLRDFFVEREGAERADQLIPQWQLSSIEEDARRASVQDTAPQASALFSEPVIEGVDAAAASAAAAEEPQGTVTPSDGASASAAEADRTSHPSQQDTTMPDEAALQERQRQLDEREQQLATREAQVAQQKAQEHRNEVTEFAEALVQAGRLLPRQKAPVIELLVSLPTDTPLEFAEGDGQVTKPAAEVLRSLLAELPKQVDFSEKSGDGGDLSFGSAHAIAARAQSYQEEQRQAGRHISTTEAVTHITKGAK
ncbi:peptidase [Pseudomonas aeruginosa]|uniref:peptidase n=1 Tax=Pseudomonas aeruginosa TaxID=287 RepID=UPI001248196F|nr:peptidase [Pseudomonas aeruginosa]KAB0747014.1 peptidase [Pseudomonas aeruginosa]MCW5476384.1 peptidase [Pseudomonas aeruginosa]MCW5484555.1 peptidase [Pseudomonas aeruginosa]MDU3313993.1 peptidase [Pseudomonas aeruginosa]